MTTVLTTSAPSLVGVEPPDLRADGVLRAWIGVSTVSWFGDAVFSIALAWTAVHVLSPGLAGLVVGVGTLPQALLMLVGGAVADRFDTRRVLVLGDLGRMTALVAASAAWQSGVHTGSVLFAVALSFGVAAGLSNPARATLVRQLVRAEDLVEVGGWTQVCARLARLVGAPVGAVLVAREGLGLAMIVDAGTFAAVAAVLTARVRTRYAIRQASPQRPLESVRRGLRHVARDPATRWLTLGMSSLNVFVVPVIGVGVAFRVTASGWGSVWVGAAEAAFAVGAICGSAAGMRWQGPRLAPRAFAVLVVQGVALAGVGVPSRATLTVSMTVVGVTAGAASVWLGGVFQRTVDPGHLGRVSAVSQLGDLTLTPAVLGLFGAVEAGAGVLACTTFCGCAMASLCAFFAGRPAIRQLP